jgi:type IV secretion system protein VirD4
VIQDLTQLQRDYKESWETFMGNAGLLTFFGNTDLTTADHIAKRIGDTEVIRTVLNASEGWQRSTGGSRPDLLGTFMGTRAGQVSEGMNEGGNRATAQQVVRGPLMNPNEIAQAFARDAGNLLAFVSSAKVPPVALYRCVYHSQEDDALFGGLFDPAPGQPPPRTSAAERKARNLKV